MPAIGSHMSRARRVADRLALPEIDDDRGAFYLGAVAPDVRVLTRRDRQETHFFDLNELTSQDSVRRMFEAYPELSRPDRLEEARAAFVAGYLTHLVMDETFIDEIYRPYFGVYSEIDDDPMSDVLDRAMQYEIDRRERAEDPDGMQEIQRALEQYQPVPGVPFIEVEYLEEWRAISADVAVLPPDYGRFRRMMSRHLDDPNISEHDLDRWAEDPGILIKEAFHIVSEERMNQFLREVEDRMTERVRGYLR